MRESNEKEKVLIGDKLSLVIDRETPSKSSKISLLGEKFDIPMSESTLSKHLLYIGGIGAGKTNAISQLVHQIKDNMTEDDVMIVFDTKGDYYNKFSDDKSKCIVISNDSNFAHIKLA